MDASHAQVSGDSHCGQPFGIQPFSHRPPEPGGQHPMPGRLAPEPPTPAPVTRHHGFLDGTKKPATLVTGR